MKLSAVLILIWAQPLLAFQVGHQRGANPAQVLHGNYATFSRPSSTRRTNSQILRLARDSESHASSRKWPKSLSEIYKPLGALLVASIISLGSLTALPVEAGASDGAAIGLCLLKQCRGELAKCITNPNCLANVICINTCNGKEDETGCQIKCGDQFENAVVGEFNKCAVSDRSCVPQQQDDGSYPVPAKEKTVAKFDTSLWNGRWYITAGQNELFDIFPCQVHFFTETAPGKFFGKLNWRIQEADGEFFTRDALQRFVQDPDWPAHLVNHDNEFLHYEDDWYILDYEPDNNEAGLPPFCLVYYRGSNDAWVGYGGAFVYTRDGKLPEAIKPRLREAAKKVNFDFDKDFVETGKNNLT
jgi:violaxanthin de-epoxidase